MMIRQHQTCGQIRTNSRQCSSYVPEYNILFSFTDSIVFPLALRYSFFALLHFQAVIRQYFLSQLIGRLLRTEIAG